MTNIERLHRFANSIFSGQVLILRTDGLVCVQLITVKDMQITVLDSSVGPTIAEATGGILESITEAIAP